MKMNATTWGISILFGILVLAGATVGIIEFSGNVAVAREKAKLKALHKPLTFSDIAPPQIPDDENAAFELKDAFDLTDKCKSLPVNVDHESLKIGELEKVFKDKYLLEAMKTAQRASEKPKCRWDLKYSDINSMLFQHFSAFRHLIRLLCLYGKLQAKTGKVHQAYKTYLSALKISFFLKSPLLIINILVQDACEGTAMKYIRNTLRESGISNDDAEMLLSELKRRDLLKWTKTALENDRVFAINEFELRISKGFTGRFDKSWKESSLLIKQDYVAFLIVFEQSLKWYSMAFWKIPGAPNEKKMDQSLLSGIPKYFTMTHDNFCYGTFRKRIAKREREIAKLRLTLLMHIYKNKHGHFPTKLSELNPEDTKGLLIDAVTGKKFKYTLKDNQININ